MRFLAEYLAERRKLNLYREPVVYEPVDATHVRADGRICLVLAANNYLGLTHHPAVMAAAAQAVNAYGAGAGGSRLTTGTHPVHSALEQEIAAFKQAEAAVLYNTGYMANVGIISAVADANTVIFSDELNHASIIDGCRLSRARVAVYRHADMEHLRQLLRTEPCGGLRLIVTDGVFSMDGDIAPLDQIVELAEEYEAMVMVDDAHAAGVIGDGGRGTVSHFGLNGRVHIQMGTLSKSLAAEGGYAAGSRQLIEFLINKSRGYIFSTAQAPATIAAARAALGVLRRQPELVAKLRANAALMRQKLRRAGLKVEGEDTAILPVLTGSPEVALAMANQLKKDGLIVAAIRPPTVPDGASRLRLTVSAAHDAAELSEAAVKIIKAGRRLKLC
ncbi:MAG: 8-amino-7-oxononanoate synthase [Negativicutes bacterium]|nr:8-amino-7-oxononanoate synthase [Negativicutes bacterium]